MLVLTKQIYVCLILSKRYLAQDPQVKKFHISYANTAHAVPRAKRSEWGCQQIFASPNRNRKLRSNTSSSSVVVKSCCVGRNLQGRPAGGMNVRVVDMSTGMAWQGSLAPHPPFTNFLSNRKHKLVVGAKDTSATASNLPVAARSHAWVPFPSRELPAGSAFAIMETRGEARATPEEKAGAHGTRLFL